jgi:hypothetical protein
LLGDAVAATPPAAGCRGVLLIDCLVTRNADAPADAPKPKKKTVCQKKKVCH